jgi:hypothetical protein
MIAFVLLALSSVIIGVQVRASRLTGSHDVFLQRLILRPGSQCTGGLVVHGPLTRGTYAVDVIFPNNSTPLDYGMAYHEVRRNVSVVVSQGGHVIVRAPNPITTAPLEDRLDFRDGVEICDFAAESAGDLTITCRLGDGPPWPDSVYVAVSHGQTTANENSPGHITKAVQPFSLGFSALLAFISIGLCWRSTAG